MVPTLSTLYTRYGDVVALNGLGEKAVVIFDPRVWAHVHNASGSWPMGATDSLWMLHQYLANSDIPSSQAMDFGTEKWESTRKAMQRSLLSPQAAGKYAAVVDHVARSNVGLLHSSGAESDVHSWLQQLSFDMVCGALLGSPLPHPSDEFHPLLKATVRSMECASGMLMSPLGKWHATLNTTLWKDWVAALDVMMDLSRSDVKAALASPPPAGFSYAHDLVEKGTLDPDRVAANIPGLLMAGFETVASTLHWTLIHLGSNQGVQDRLRAEIVSVIKDDVLDRAHLRSLPFLRATLKEVQRCTPTAFMFVRKLQAPLTVPTQSGDSVTLPSDAWLAFSPVGVAHDPALVHNPHLFSPDRFLPPASDNKESLIYHPLMRDGFSVGPRMCLGARIAQLEIVAAVVALLRDYRIVTAPTPYEIHNHASTFPSPSPSLSLSPI